MLERSSGHIAHLSTHLDTFNVSSSPQRFKNQVGETQNSEVFDELLSKVMINPEMLRHFLT